MLISEEAAIQLLKIARQAVEAAIYDAKAEPVEVGLPELQEQCGAFVTLTAHGNLRGCIGQFSAKEPLYETVGKMARAAVLEDPRFFGKRIKPSELPDLRIEVSVLSPMQRVYDPLNDVRLGEHGIYIRKGYNSGTFLPQVATEHDMTLEEFLSSCCTHKAGLPPDAWQKSDTEVYVYSAQILHE